MYVLNILFCIIDGLTQICWNIEEMYSLKFKHDSNSAIKKLVLPVETFKVFTDCWLEQNLTKTFIPRTVYQLCIGRRSDPAAVQYPVCLQGRLHGREAGRDIKPLRGGREHQRPGRGGEEAGRVGQRPVHQHVALLLCRLFAGVRGWSCSSPH